MSIAQTFDLVYMYVGVKLGNFSKARFNAGLVMCTLSCDGTGVTRLTLDSPTQSAQYE